jgi:hypothetical protein
MFSYILVGGIPTPLKKYEFVSWYYSHLNGKSEKPCSKPPTSIYREHDDKPVDFGYIHIHIIGHVIYTTNVR